MNRSSGVVVATIDVDAILKDKAFEAQDISGMSCGAQVLRGLMSSAQNAGGGTTLGSNRL